MLDALKLLGLAFLGGAVLLLVGIGFLIWFIRRWFRRAIQEEQSFIPPRVTLEPEPNPQWKNQREIENYSNQFRHLGFKEIGAFQIPELRGLLLRAFYHPAQPLYATVYDHHQVAPTADISRRFADGFTVAAANTALTENLDQRPEAKSFHLPNASMQQLLEAVISHQHEATPLDHSPENFVQRFQHSYLESSTWRIKRGGVSKDEIRRHAAAKGHKLDEEQVNEAWESQRRQYRRQVREACIAQYLDDSQMHPADWDRISDRVIVLAETYALKEIIEVIDSEVILDEEQEHTLGKIEVHFGQTGVDIGLDILSRNTAGLNLARLGEVEAPIRALLVLAPEPSVSAKAA